MLIMFTTKPTLRRKKAHGCVTFASPSSWWIITPSSRDVESQISKNPWNNETTYRLQLKKNKKPCIFIFHHCLNQQHEYITVFVPKNKCMKNKIRQEKNLILHWESQILHTEREMKRIVCRVTAQRWCRIHKTTERRRCTVNMWAQALGVWNSDHRYLSGK